MRQSGDLEGIKKAIFWICFIGAVVYMLSLFSSYEEGGDTQGMLLIGGVLVVGLSILRAVLYKK